MIRDFWRGASKTFLNVLFDPACLPARWNVEKNEWRQIESPNTPPPRCSHQAAFFRDQLYVLGGEFATTEQFYHYKDFWRLNVKVRRSFFSQPPFVGPRRRACA